MKAVDRYLLLGETTYHVVLEPDGETLTVRIDDGEPIAVPAPPEGATVFPWAWGGGPQRRIALARTERGAEVSVDGRRMVVLPSSPAAAAADEGAGSTRVEAPMPGKIVELVVAAGDRVARGDKAVVVEAMKMRTSLNAGCTGTVVAVHVAQGDQVTGGEVLVEFEPDEEE